MLTESEKDWLKRRCMAPTPYCGWCMMFTFCCDPWFPCPIKSTDWQDAALFEASVAAKLWRRRRWMENKKLLERTEKIWRHIIAAIIDLELNEKHKYNREVPKTDTKEIIKHLRLAKKNLESMEIEVKEEPPQEKEA